LSERQTNQRKVTRLSAGCNSLVAVLAPKAVRETVRIC